MSISKPAQLWAKINGNSAEADCITMLISGMIVTTMRTKVNPVEDLRLAGRVQ